MRERERGAGERERERERERGGSSQIFYQFSMRIHSAPAC